MKYSVKVDIFNQKDVNAGQAPSGSTLPVQLESVEAYSIISDFRTVGDVLFTPEELKAQVRTKLHITDTVTETLSLSGEEVVGIEPLTGRNYKYKVILPVPVLG